MSNGQTKKDLYFYRASSTALAAAGSDTDQVKIETDANFLWVKSAYQADIAAATQTENTRVLPLITVELLDSGSGRNLQDNPIPIDSMAGRGLLPMVLPIPRLFRANSTISVTFTNFSAATTYNIYLTLIGYKVFSY